MNGNINITGETRLNNNLSIVNSGIVNYSFTNQKSTIKNINDLEINTDNKIDIDSSGSILVKSFTDDITLEASEIKINGKLDVNKNLDVSGETKLNNKLDVRDSTNLRDTLNVDGITTLSNLNVNSQLNVTGTSETHHIIPKNEDSNLGSKSNKWNNVFAKDLTTDAESLQIGGIKLSTTNGVLRIKDTSDNSGLNLHFTKENFLLDSDSLSITKNVSMSNNLTISGETTLSKTNINGDLNMNCNTFITGNIDLTGQTKLNGH